MDRFKLVLVLLACVYVASWFMPAVVVTESVYAEGWNVTVGEHYVAGYWTFLVALGPKTPLGGGEVGMKASGVSNVWFMVALVLLLRSPRRFKPWMFWGVVCCVATNASWWILSGYYGSAMRIGIGYYLWLGSFVGLAVAAWFARRESSAKSPN